MPGRGDTSRRLRVALVASSLGLAGAEKQTVYTARALLHAGIDVRFFYLGGSGHYEAVLRHLGVSLCQIFAANRPWVILAGLTRALCRLRPHIVMASQFSDLLYGGAAGRFCNAMTLGGIRSDGFYELSAYGQRSRWMFRLAHGLIANSCRARQNLASRGINLRKIEVLPNVIDLRDFDSRSKLPGRFSLPANRIIVAYGGEPLDPKSIVAVSCLPGFPCRRTGSSWRPSAGCIHASVSIGSWRRSRWHDGACRRWRVLSPVLIAGPKRHCKKKRAHWVWCHRISPSWANMIGCRLCWLRPGCSFSLRSTRDSRMSFSRQWRLACRLSPPRQETPVWWCNMKKPATWLKGRIHKAWPRSWFNWRDHLR